MDVKSGSTKVKCLSKHMSLVMLVESEEEF